MPGKNSRMNARETRKQLLIAESDLNRAQLACDWQTMSDELHTLSKRAKTLGALASVTAALLAGFSTLRRRSAPTGSAPTGPAKSGRWQTLLKAAGIAASLWSEIRSLDRRKENREPRV